MPGGIHFRRADFILHLGPHGAAVPSHGAYKTGYLARYAKLVTSAARGAVLE